jgi:hypothetical protein
MQLTALRIVELAAASLLATFIVTILSGICYATSKASPDVASTILSVSKIGEA